MSRVTTRSVAQTLCVLLCIPLVLVWSVQASGQQKQQRRPAAYVSNDDADVTNSAANTREHVLTRHDHGYVNNANLHRLFDIYDESFPIKAEEEGEEKEEKEPQTRPSSSSSTTRRLKASRVSSFHNPKSSKTSSNTNQSVRLRRREAPPRSQNDGQGSSRRADEAAAPETLTPGQARDLFKEIQDSGCNGSDKGILKLRNTFPQAWTQQYFSNHSTLAISTANVLNNMFRVWDSKPVSLYNDAFFFSLAKAFLANDRAILGASIAFDADQYVVNSPDSSNGSDSNTPSTTVSFAQYVRRDLANPDRHQTLDIAQLTKSRYPMPDTPGYDWFWKHRDKNFSNLLWDNRSVCDRVNPQDVVGSYSSVPSVTTTQDQGLWTEPYYDCQRTQAWVVTYSVPFFGCAKENTIRFKGVVAVDVPLISLDINQCDTSEQTAINALSGTHKCRNSTECVFNPGRGLRLGGYNCLCKPGYYYAPASNSDDTAGFSGPDIERDFENSRHIYDYGYQCTACGRGCNVTDCHDNTPCYVTYDVMIRGISIGVVSFCMSVCLILAIVIIRMRKTKVMKASMWILLEIMILGSMLLYSTVIIQYFEPTTLTCILLPWFREVGFAIVYGAILLKIYRILSEFQSRKAHRVHVRDKDLLKYTSTIVVIVIGFMAAWTAVNLDYVINDDVSLMDEGHLAAENLSFIMCREMWWDYVIELLEFLLLLFAIYLCYRTRSAPSDYLERRYLSIVIYNETVVSTLTHIIRHFLWGIIHPDYIYLMYMIRCQLTVSICIVLVLGPKLWYAHRPPEDDHFRNRAYSSSDVHDSILPESMKLHAGVNSNGDVDLAELNLSDMDPEDIRAELKRLYTQLQIYRTKMMRKDNAHISKRRGGRKPTHRRFSLQAFHHKHRHMSSRDPSSVGADPPSTLDHDHEMSKTPEESTNSAENVQYSIGESTCSVGGLGGDGGSERRIPTVTFKPGHKSFY